MYKVKLDGKYFYHPWDRCLSITDGKLTQELNKNGSFDFSFAQDHPLAGSILRRKSIVEVLRFDKTGGEELVYRGCCLNDTAGADLETEVQTDGDLVFLSDTVIRPYGIDGVMEHTPAEHFAWLIEQHNAQTDDFKQFQVGTVNVQGEPKRWQQETYNSTRTEVDSLITEYGGYVRTRTEGDVHYIDYLAEYGAVSFQGVRQGKNIIDITKYVKTDELATRVIPLGAVTNDNMPLTIKYLDDNPWHLDYLQDEDAVREFGVITKAVEFPDILLPEKLLQAGKDYLETVKGVNLTVELTAIDLADAGYDMEAINVGDMVPCVAPAYRINTQMQVSKKVTDLLKTESSRITLGSTVRTLTQKQLSDSAGVLPMVRQAVSTAGSAYGSANQAVDGVQDVRKQVEELRAGQYVHPSCIPRTTGLYKVAVDSKGHVTDTAAVAKTDITALGIPGSDTTYGAATTGTAGLMSAGDKAKLDGIASGANKYVLPTASSSTLGGVRTTSTVKSGSGHTACPIISGVPYYKTVNTGELVKVSTLTLSSMSLDAGWDGQTTGTVPAMTGYTPVLVTPKDAGTSDVCWISCVMSGTTVTAKLKNTTTVAKTGFTPSVYVLYLKNS